jgi:hypothetical protein
MQFCPARHPHSGAGPHWLLGVGKTQHNDCEQEPLAHLLLQAPQLLGSLVTSTHEPAQSCCPVGHWQAPFRHV